MSWLEEAKKLPVGKNAYINHHCGGGKTLAINNTFKGYSCYCFRCGETSFKSKGQLTLEELALIKQQNALHEQEVKLALPDDFTLDIPLEGRIWLFKAGITVPVYESYGIGYSPSWNRVIIPIYEQDKLVWFQARALSKHQQPKYLQPSAEKATVLFKTHSYNNNRERVVITEDMLSAIRVGTFIPTVSILGTKITTEQSNEIAQFNRVTTWLDSDKAGRKGSYAIRKGLSLVTDVDDIVTDEDPKLLSNMNIKEALCI